MLELGESANGANAAKVVKSAQTSNQANDDRPTSLASRHNNDDAGKPSMTFEKMGDWSLMTATR